jgi:hypothetical protein
MEKQFDFRRNSYQMIHKLGWATHSDLVGGVGGFLIISSILMVGVGGGGLIFKKSMVGVGGWWVEDFFNKSLTKI